MNKQNLEAPVGALALMCVILLVISMFQGLKISDLQEKVVAIETTVMMPWDAQINLNEAQNQRDDFQDQRLAELENNILDIYGHISTLQDNIIFIFRVIDDYIL